MMELVEFEDKLGSVHSQRKAEVKTTGCAVSCVIGIVINAKAVYHLLLC